MQDRIDSHGRLTRQVIVDQQCPSLTRHADQYLFYKEGGISDPFQYDRKPECLPDYQKKQINPPAKTKGREGTMQITIFI